MNLLTALVLGTALTAPSVVVASEPSRSASDPVLEVYVRDAATYELISGAAVRIISKSGQTLATARTDSSGVASLPVLDSSSNPDLILVLADAYYVGGTQWSAGSREICVHLAIWRTCDQVKIKAQ